MNRNATAVWKGPGPEGQGTLTTTSGALQDQPYSAKLRFVDEDGRAGTNPEELLGAAHAGCFAMALAFKLTAAGHSAEEIRTEAKVELLKKDAGWTITAIALDCAARVPGIDAAKFAALAEETKTGCPVSRLLAPGVPITLSARLS